MNLYAISDLHLGYSVNRQALAQLPAYPNDWLIVAGDVGETEAQFVDALQLLTSRFAQVLWVPGNHDLWTLPND
ncbi:MAG: metallophosphoesterase, partial [Caldilineaceae bacterium]|nr:metallophosphoesterase [Caldilineaceae bacterium]